MRPVLRFTLLVIGAVGLAGCARPLAFGGSQGLKSAATPNDYQQIAKDYQQRSLVAPAMGLDNHLEPNAAQRFGSSVVAVPATVGSSVKKGAVKLASWTTPDNAATTTTAPASSGSWFSKKPEASPELCVATARLYERTGNFAAASEQYEKALKKAPNDVPALLSYAHLLDHQGKLVDAEKLYRRAVKVNPREASAYNDLGLCLARRGMTKDALAAVATASQMQPDKVLYRNNLATLLVEQKRPEEALIQLRAVHSEAIAHYNLACLLEQQKQETLAQTHFQRALEMDPSFTAAREATVRLASRSGGVPPAAAYQRAYTPATANAATLATPARSPYGSSVDGRIATQRSPMTGTMPRPGAYGVAPEPSPSQYLRPEMSSPVDPAQVSGGYATGQYSVPSATASIVRPGDPTMPPTPDNVSNYSPTIDGQLRFLPPVQ